MAEQFLTLMADLDDESQKLMAGWYDELKAAGYIGTQTPGLPYHISLAAFSLEKEVEITAEMKKIADEYAQIPIHISHVGIFEGGNVLFAAPDMNPSDLLSLRKAIRTETNDKYPWTPHCTILIDEPIIIQKAVPVLMKSFQSFYGKITKLHLCAFWPTREIATLELKETDS